MEHKLTATGPAVVKKIAANAGDQVDIGDVLIQLEPSDQEG